MYIYGSQNLESLLFDSTVLESIVLPSSIPN